MKVCKFLALALFAITMSFTACGDDESSSGVAPESAGEISTNSSASSSSVKSSTSGKSSAKSSSSEKSSSSTGLKSSSSVKPGSSVSFALSSARSSSSYTECKQEGKLIQRYNMETGQDELYICQDGFYVLLVLSSSSAEPSSSYFNMDSLYNSETSYGEFTDPRDGQKYKTLHITTSWLALPEFEAFAQNLNYGVQIKLNTTEFDDGKVEKYCYDDDPWYCDNGFGGLYSWSEAMGLPKACDSVWTGTTPACPDSLVTGEFIDINSRDLIRQGACPEGWHVMNGREWMALMSLDVTETGYAITSKVFAGRESTANGTGFSAVYGGMTNLPTQYERIGDLGVYHLAFEYEAGRHNAVALSNDFNITYKDHHPKIDGLSVRCVKDY